MFSEIQLLDVAEIQISRFKNYGSDSFRNVEFVASDGSRVSVCAHARRSPDIRVTVAGFEIIPETPRPEPNARERRADADAAKPANVDAARVMVRELLTELEPEPDNPHLTRAEIIALRLLVNATEPRTAARRCDVCGNAPATRQRKIDSRGRSECCEYCAGRIDADEYHNAEHSAACADGDYSECVKCNALPAPIVKPKPVPDVNCPVCGCVDIEGGSVDVNGATAEQNQNCCECGAEWFAEFRLTERTLTRERRP